ncbi:Glycoside hydrolase [Mycena chlorophos]|uniref:mannan endo-1,4-beta-mannosidase n=1 Tax=Mycena chlorophos TaxID=658473 RepID=A0A8H6SB09_MYCCL|nr:Glycoside hydrolase [Mycena chlorophos]
MLRRISAVFLVAAICVRAQTTVPVYGQCGGIGYTGSTVCASGSYCYDQNPYYSQCIPGTTSTSSTSTHSTTTTSSSTTSKSTTTSSTSTTTTSAPTGFVKASGTRFEVNGAQFVPVGTNAYWPALIYQNENIDQAFSDIAATGATVVRTWFFNEVTSASGVYLHLWDGSTATFNTGATGFGAIDTVIAKAKQYGLRVIATLNNNWNAYGGIDVYTTQILGSSGTYHDTFFSNAQVIAAYKEYVQFVVNRYVDEPGILGWELLNEPRCSGSGPLEASPTCNVTTITNWVSELSAYIKSIDSNHLVGLGDEGFFNEPGNSQYVYGGGAGMDFAANLALSSIDFGTFHMYPDSWGYNDNETLWGEQWILDHASAMKTANKPVILEEYGLTSTGTAREAIYQSYWNTIVSSGLTGDLYWQAGSNFTTNANDGYMIFPTDPVYTAYPAHASAVKARG